MEENRNAFSQLTSRHLLLLDKYKDAKPEDIKTSEDVLALIAFNGYYTLQNTPGAFFAIDTNIIVYQISEGNQIALHLVDLIISLDGKQSLTVTFTNGTFDGSHLHFEVDSVIINLYFQRSNVPSDDGYSPTATVEGTIQLPESSPVEVLGSTYNNPIPSALYAGSYHLMPPVPPNSLVTLCHQLNCMRSRQVIVEHVEVLRINENSEVFYDYGKNNGQLDVVKMYAYNMNMYYFTFLGEAPQQIHMLIMGTAAEGGFACNNMIVSSTLKSRSLQTIPTPTMHKMKTANPDSAALASFSGYYSLPSINPKAFISIESEYLTSGSSYIVKIGVSVDGVNSDGYYFDVEGMSFRNNTLTMQEQDIAVTFNREYDSSNGSLVKMAGIFNGNRVDGFTLFNPVPLSSFGGVTMTGGGDSLTVATNDRVIYNGSALTNFLYVPIMYILAYPPPQKTKIEMSFGTSGGHGNVCIIMPKGSVVSAIPNPSYL